MRRGDARQICSLAYASLVATAEEFETAGLYDPSVDAETGRLDLLEWLDAQGVTRRQGDVRVAR